ncbi:Translation elongation factor G-related protein [Salinispira pacifica]|uniref:Elongation factor G n=2 Tax=Salinispira pacifica TaxID=1307761 RepID=V5WIS7_9SPIO|nr:Translation elongation factor G-related protein [Salinispira pacifica]
MGYAGGLRIYPSFLVHPRPQRCAEKEGIMSFRTEDIRNIAVAGHGGTGKTTFVENLLFDGGAIDKPETAESGKSVSDFTDEEISHNMSIHTSLSHIFWKDHKINILDTPGSADFVGEVVAAFRTAESAVIMVDAESGVQIETIKLWRRLEARDEPRIVFINKMDKDRADFNRSIEDLEQKFGKQFVPVTIPIGSGSDYKGIIDLIHMKAYLSPGSGKKSKPSDIPAELKEMAQEYHEKMVEAAALGDDDLTEKYLEEMDLTVDDAIKGLTEDLVEGKVVPVFCGSALLNSGIAAVLDFLNIAAPAPTGIDEVRFDLEKKEHHTPISQEGEFSGFCFKTSIDQYAGKLSFIKAVTGCLSPDQEVYNIRERKKERISKIYMSLGKKLEEVDSLCAGDLGIISKIPSAHTNDTFSAEDHELIYKPLQLPQPVHKLAISAGSKKDQDKLGEQLQRAAEEDKTLSLNFDSETKETVFSGMGELHLNLIFEKIKAATKIEVVTKTPRIAYRETITRPAETEFTHKKQTGGHGQYARVNMRFRPLERGEGFVFKNVIRGGSISKGYMPGIEKGLLEAMEEGPLAGYPVVDLEAEVYDGKEHPVDSSEMAFKMAAKGALKEAFEKAAPKLLEPFVELHVFVEDQYMGDVLSDLSSKRGRVHAQNDLGGGIMEIVAEVPQGELMRYSIDLRSITSGTGGFELEFSHYEPVAGKIADNIIAEARALSEEES